MTTHDLFEGLVMFAGAVALLVALGIVVACFWSVGRDMLKGKW